MSALQKRSRPVFLVALGACIAAFGMGGCPGNTNNGNTDDGVPQAVRATISAAKGGTISTDSGVTLVIPAGALAEDTEIVLTTVTASALSKIDSSFLAGVILEPDGLTFSTPATLRVPLPAALDADFPPRELVFKGTDPKDAVETGTLVGLSADGRTAIITVTHFSGRVCANNCHEGVRQFLKASFASRSCPQAEWEARVVGKYPGYSFGPCDTIKAGAIHAIVDSYFDFYAGADGDTDIPVQTLAELEAFAAAGRHVVLLFGKDAMPERSGERMFYGNVAHSAIVEMKDGKWQMRHTFVPGGVPLAAIDNTNFVWWPLSDLNAFRRLRQGVGIEMAVCGTPGCLGSADPEAKGKPYNPLETRIVPWNAVRIFVEREDNSPCNRLGGCWTFDAPDSEDEGSFMLRFDDDGQVDSLLASNVTAGTADHAASEVFVELFRFARANAQQLLPYVERVSEGVDLSSDQASFSSDFEITFIGRDGGGTITSRVEYFFKLAGATLSKNEPSEFFDAQWELRIRITVTDDEGMQQTDETTSMATIRAHRVPCPTVAAGTLIPQESWDTEGAFGADFDFSICGTGVGGGAPLMMAMLLTSIGVRRRRMARQRDAA